MNCKFRLSKDIYMRMYRLGFNDKEISLFLDLNYSHVCKYRRKLNLEPINIKNKNSVFLNKDEESILIGTMIGDSYIRYIYKEMKNPTFGFTHSEKNKEYFLYKYRLLKKILSSYGTYENSESSFFSKHKRLVATGKTLKVLNKYRDIFYPKGIKIIPMDLIKSKFNEISLAFLFMDDGNKSGKTINLNLQCFELNNIKEFTGFLYDKFNLEFTIKKDKTLYLRQKSIKQFYKLVNGYITKDMEYKLEGIMSSLNSVNSEKI